MRILREGDQTQHCAEELGQRAVTFGEAGDPETVAGVWSTDCFSRLQSTKDRKRSEQMRMLVCVSDFAQSSGRPQRRDEIRADTPCFKSRCNMLLLRMVCSPSFPVKLQDSQFHNLEPCRAGRAEFSSLRESTSREKRQPKTSLSKKTSLLLPWKALNIHCLR